MSKISLYGRVEGYKHRVKAMRKLYLFHLNIYFMYLPLSLQLKQIFFIGL